MASFIDIPTFAPVTAATGAELVGVFDPAELKTGPAQKSISVGELLTQVVATLPTSDPSVAGALWVNAGVVSVSAG